MSWMGLESYKPVNERARCCRRESAFASRLCTITTRVKYSEDSLTSAEQADASLPVLAVGGYRACQAYAKVWQHCIAIL